ncbi:MAG: HAMP domain-containing sensor histidine kinase [Synechococcus sp.]|nr:HAMP domain-containing sensor histidine kinase [Synechococcus sp.]
MSHELRTPLNAILGTTEILQEEIYGPITPKQDQALTTIDQSGTHLLELINEILELATIEAGQFELELDATAIAHLCESSLVFLKSQAQKKQIKLTLECPPDLPQFYLDERRIRRALINLLSNAVKFTPSGGQVKLRVTYPVPGDTSHDSLSYLRLQVEDNGIGIDPKNFQALFEPFIQVDRALNRQHEGTGLGLALVKQIVELHGGQVRVTSEVGAGSCFMIDLPSQPVPGEEPRHV